VTFHGNESSNFGGAVYSDGQEDGISSPRFTNVTFSDNEAGNYGGAMYNNGYGGLSSPILGT